MKKYKININYLQCVPSTSQIGALSSTLLPTSRTSRSSSEEASGSRCLAVSGRMRRPTTTGGQDFFCLQKAKKIPEKYCISLLGTLGGKHSRGSFLSKFTYSTRNEYKIKLCYLRYFVLPVTPDCKAGKVFRQQKCLAVVRLSSQTRRPWAPGMRS